MCRCESGWSPQFRWAEDDRLSSTIRRAYRPRRKPWRSGFDSRHGVPPFDHVTCPSSFAEAATFAAHGSEPHPRSLCESAGFADSPVVQLRKNARIQSGRRGFDSHRERQFRRAVEFGLSVKRETASAFKPRTIGQLMDSHLASCPSSFRMGRCASVIELSSSTASEHLVKTSRCGFDSRPETSKPPLVHPPAVSTGRRIGLSPPKRVVAGSSPAFGSRCRSSSVVEHVKPHFVSYPSD